MLPPARLLDAYQSAERDKTAAIVEFGVYMGGALASMACGANSSSKYTGRVIGFDTFEGHTVRPLPDEIDIHGQPQLPIFQQKATNGESWAACDIKTVLINFKEIAKSFGAACTDPHLIKGDACETAQELENHLDGYCIGVLRLDMD